MPRPPDEQLHQAAGPEGTPPGRLDVELLTEDEARQLTDEIAGRMTAMLDLRDELLPMIRRARGGEAWRALGYPSWSAYCSARFPMLRLPVTDRQHLVAELADDGMSQREIGAALGVDHATVSRDLRGGASAPVSQPSVEYCGPFRVHPFLARLPWVSDDVFADIVEDIRVHGLREPIVLTWDAKTIVDGRIRYRACLQAGVSPRFTMLDKDCTELEILRYIWSKNVVRQHLTVDQWVAIMVELGERQ